jgi:predicted DNA-binding transcriptional regulator AlpA
MQPRDTDSLSHQSHDKQLHGIPETGFLRLPQVLSIIPLGKTSWWEGVRSGRFPKPVKLSARCTAWRAEDIRDLIKNLSDRAPNP